MSAIGTKRTYRVAPHMSAFGGKADIADRLVAVPLNKVSVAKAQRVLMRIEAGCPDSLKRLTGVIFVPLTFRIERS